MLNLLNIAGGILTTAIGLVMVFVAIPRKGVSLKFLEAESVSTIYVITSLGLIVMGIAWAINYSVAAFTS